MSLRKEKENELRKALIADTAMRLFREHSFDTVKVADIAREAEFGKGTVYLFFKSKEEIMIYLICRGLEQLCLSMQEKIKDHDKIPATLEAFIELQYQFDREYQAFFLALGQRRMDEDLPPEFWQRIGACYQEKMAVMTDLILTGQESNIIRPGDAGLMAKGVANTIKGFALGDWEQRQDETERQRDMVLLKEMLFSSLLVVNREV